MNRSEEILKQAFGHYNAGRYDEAEQLCRALAMEGLNDGQLFFLLGMILHDRNREIEAAQWLQRAAKLQPESARIFAALGNVWQKLADPARAVNYFARATDLEPAKSNHYYSLGNAAYQLNELERATAAFQKAAELNPQDAESWNNLGKCLKELNRVDESIVAYDRALALKPDYLLALQGRSLSLLAAGRLAEGFRDYEVRWLTLKSRELTGPRWAGEPIAGKTLFLHAEQGFGDGIQSARYAKLARQRCGQVILECRPELKSLLTHSHVADEVIAYGEPIPKYDVYTSVVSLPGLLGLTFATIPSEVPYLSALPSVLPLRVPGEPLRIGLVWAGSALHKDDVNRSMPLAMLQPLLAVTGVKFYGLQKPVPQRDVETLKQFPQLTVMDKFPDYLATASAVEMMDLIISVDTSVAHLAGALGKPVWNLIQFAPDWRWFAQFGERTPWYPTMRLFRQSRRGDWAAVSETVADALRQWVAERHK